MSSFVSAPATGGELRAIKYEPARVHRYGKGDKYELDIPASVSFKVGDAHVSLTIPDAQDLLEALPTMLAQHEWAEFAADDSRAVA